MIAYLTPGPPFENQAVSDMFENIDLPVLGDQAASEAQAPFCTSAAPRLGPGPRLS